MNFKYYSSLAFTLAALFLILMSNIPKVFATPLILKNDGSSKKELVSIFSNRTLASTTFRKSNEEGISSPYKMQSNVDMNDPLDFDDYYSDEEDIRKSQDHKRFRRESIGWDKISSWVAPQFLSYSNNFVHECTSDALEGLNLGTWSIIQLALTQAEPLIESYGEVHISINLPFKFEYLGLQFVSDDGFPLGHFPKPFPSELTSKFCRPDLTFKVEDAEVYTGPLVSATGQQPQVEEIRFGIPKPDYHGLWIHSLGEFDKVKKGFQLQLYIVPQGATCFILEPSPIYSIPQRSPESWPRINAPPSSPTFICHGNHVNEISNPRVPLEISDEYMRKVEEQKEIQAKILRRGDYCPKGRLFENEHDGPVSEATSKLLENMLEFSLFPLLDKEVKGWYRILVSAKGYKFKRIALRVLTKGGFILGKYLRAESVPCRDLPNPVNAGNPEYKFFQAPDFFNIKSPTTLEVLFDDYVTEFSIFWVYRYEESFEVQDGVEIQAYLLDVANIKDKTSVSETDRKFIRQFSRYFVGLETFPTFRRNMKAEDTGKFQTCTQQRKTATVFAETRAMLIYDYKKLCESIGLRPGSEPESLWVPVSIKPPSTGRNVSVANPGKVADLDIPQLIVGGTGKRPKVDYLDKDYLDYGSRRAEFNDSLNQAKVLAVEHKGFYTGCGEIKTCIGFASSGVSTKCLEEKNCAVAVAFRKRKDRCLLELLGVTRKYVAIGLSRDQNMGEDSVMECVREDGNNIRVYMSYNAPADRGRINNRIKIQGNAIVFLKGWFNQDNLLYCAFQRNQIVTVRNNTFDLVKEQFYILAAHGDSASPTLFGGIHWHNRGSYASDVKYALMDPIGKSKGQVIAETIHSVLIIFAWMFCYPIGTFMVRYFKETYINKFIYGFSIWYGAHITLIGTTIIITVGTIIPMLATQPEFDPFNESGYENGWYFHNMAGYTLVCIMLAQGMLGLFIATRKKEQRIRPLHCLHGLVGHSLFFLSYTILVKSKNMATGFPCAGSSILTTWIVLYFLIHLMMSYQVCYIDYIHGLDISRVYGLTMLQIAQTTESEGEAPSGRVRKALLCVFVFCSGVSTLIVMIMSALYVPDCTEFTHHHEFAKELLGDDD